MGNRAGKPGRCSGRSEAKVQSRPDPACDQDDQDDLQVDADALQKAILHCFAVLSMGLTLPMSILIAVP